MNDFSVPSALPKIIIYILIQCIRNSIFSYYMGFVIVKYLLILF